MPSTSRFGLRYPGLTDAPDGAQLGGDLAADVEGWLARAYPCTSTTRPTGVGAGFIIREDDTSAVLIYDGDEWLPITSAAGGGGGTPGTGEHAQYSASAAQSVPSGTNTTMAFGAEDVASPAVTRSANGSGHQFTVQPGLWIVTATVRYAGATATGERYAGIHLPGVSGGTPLGGEGGDVPAGRPVTVNVAVTKEFTSPTPVIVNLWQGTGGARQLELGGGGGWCRLNLTRIGT